jgi:hypothetical protein
MPEDSAPKKPKKLTLGEFVETNQRLLSVLGIFAALTVFGGNLPEPLIGQMLSFSCLSITILIAIEVWRRLPMDFYDLDKLSNQAELSVVFFWLFLFISTFILIVNWIFGFPEISEPLIQALLVIPAGSIVVLFLVIMRAIYARIMKIESIRKVVSRIWFFQFLRNQIIRLPRFVQFLFFLICLLIFLFVTLLITSWPAFYVNKVFAELNEEKRTLVKPVTFANARFINTTFTNVVVITNYIPMAKPKLVEPVVMQSQSLSNNSILPSQSHQKH